MSENRGKPDSIDPLDSPVVQDAIAVANREKKGRRTAAEKTMFENGIWWLGARGYNQAEIARILDMTPGYISQTISSIVDRVLTQMFREVEAERYRQYLALMMIYREAFASWMLSKNPSKKISTKRTEKTQVIGGKRVLIPPKDGEHETAEVQTVVEEQPGDPRYLTAAMKALDDIRQLLGIAKPMQVEVDWQAELLKSGFNAQEVFEMTVLRLQGKLKAEGNINDYNLFEDENVLNLLDEDTDVLEAKIKQEEKVAIERGKSVFNIDIEESNNAVWPPSET